MKRLRLLPESERSEHCERDEKKEKNERSQVHISKVQQRLDAIVSSQPEVGSQHSQVHIPSVSDCEHVNVVNQESGNPAKAPQTLGEKRELVAETIRRLQNPSTLSLTQALENQIPSDELGEILHGLELDGLVIRDGEKWGVSK